MPDAVFFGDVARDRFWRVERWPAEGEKVEAVSAGSFVGGMTANAARTHAALGGEAEFVTWVPDDAEGESLVAGLAAAGVGVSLVERDPRTVLEVSHVYGTRREHTVFFSGGDEHPLAVGEAAWAAMLASPWLVTSVYRLRRLRGPGGAPAAPALAELRAAGVRIAVDCDVEPWREDDELLALADLIVMNGLGFERRFGEEGGGGEEHADERAAAWLRRRAPVATIVRTRGAEGAVALTADRRCAARSPRAEVVDVTGAGDALLGALVRELGAGAPIEQALPFATACASLAVERLGPVRADLTRELVRGRLAEAAR